jgi:hypothetical protein
LESKEVDVPYDVYMDDFKLTKFTMDVFEKFGEDIEDQSDIRNIIDALFIKDAWVIRVQMFIFVFGFMIPFLLQLLSLRDPSSVMTCLNICLFTEILFLGIEIQQIYDQQWSYFKSVWNITDLSMFLLFWVYYVIRSDKPNREMLPYAPTEVQLKELLVVDGNVVDDVYTYDKEERMIYIIVNTLLLIFTCVKVMFFATVNANFGILVELISKVIYNVGNFTIIFFFTIVLFDLLFIISGTEVIKEDDDGDQYPNLNVFFYYFI